MTDRREFLALVAAGLSLAPAPARGQQRAKVSRVGVLSPFDRSDDAFLEVFRQALREHGHSFGLTHRAGGLNVLGALRICP